ncbi:putative chromatin assembly factor 1 subunit a [Phaeomoniella chlamydospora]|uniref:Putative chromatin assembly factor 1 subunit a n=1 Tax=Phaeomoniella chlamydospora TaxID=158046 RepID=A0A0G2G3I8_PHACM|nr:putative chromatin assembly factor 1 subunit a [Phaeomoniella chlamydospora]
MEVMPTATNASLESHKRTFEEADMANTSSIVPEDPFSDGASSILTPISSTPSRASTIDLDLRSRQGSPAASVTSSAPTSTSNAQGPASKKRKLTFAEKEVERAVKRQEKEEKERLKAQEKARKEEEKRIKDEEKRRKEEEKEVARRQKEIEKAEKQKVKDAEKAAKDAERQAREGKKKKEEEEKQKKQRSQMRLNAFFIKPASTPQPNISTDISPPAAVSSPQKADGSRRGSVASVGDENNGAAQTPSKKIKTDYQNVFLDFSLPSNTVIAPYYRCHRDAKALKNAVASIDEALTKTDAVNIDFDVHSLFRSNAVVTRRGRLPRRSVRELVNTMGGSSNEPIDLTGDHSNKGRVSLAGIPVKVLFFREDVRPPYQGTYTRRVSPKSATKLSRRPFSRSLPDTNYDYDSEAEWEPPQEGDEDLESEDDDEEDEGDDDMDGFLDDENDTATKKGLLGGNEMEPVCTGIVWEGERENMVINGLNLNSMRIDVLNDDHQFPIDPFSNKYWKPTKSEEVSSASSTTSMQPPSRSPLTSVKSSNAVFNQGTIAPVTQSSGEPQLVMKATGQQPSTRGRPRKDPSRPLKMISPDLLPEFKQAVSGSNLSKAGLVEVLKKQFPKIAKDIIKDTLTAVATREGVKEADKVWVLVNT